MSEEPDAFQNNGYEAVYARGKGRSLCRTIEEAMMAVSIAHQVVYIWDPDWVMEDLLLALERRGRR